jgi:hypothetical protein
VPQARAGATLDEAAARQRALAAVKERFGLEASQVKEISAKPQKQKARTDWTFTFTDTTVAPLNDGEPRIDVDLAGDEVASAGRYVYVPEDWQRQQRAGSTRNFIIQIATSVVFGGLLLSAAIAGMVAWSRSLYTPRLFLAAAVLVFLVSAANLLNNAPLVIAMLPTAAPLIVELTGVIAASMIGLTLIGALVGLAIGALPHLLAPLGRLSDRDALRLGVAAGLFAAAAGTLAALVRTPIWAQFPTITGLGAAVPLLQLALEPIVGFMTRMAVVTATLATIERLTASWTRRRIPAIAAIAAIGFLAGGAPAGTNFAGWAIAGAVTAAAFVILYAGLLRFDLTLVPLCLGTMMAIGAIARGAQRAFPGALAGSLAGGIVVLAMAYWWFRRLRSS